MGRDASLSTMSDCLGSELRIQRFGPSWTDNALTTSRCLRYDRRTVTMVKLFSRSLEGSTAYGP